MRTEEEIREMFEKVKAVLEATLDPTCPEYDLIEQSDLEGRFCILEWVLGDSDD